MSKTAVNRHVVIPGTTQVRTINIDGGAEFGGSTYNYDQQDVFSDVTEVRQTVNSAMWVRANRWSGAQKQALRPNPFSYSYSWLRPLWGVRTEIVPSQGFISVRSGRIIGWNGEQVDFSEEERLAIREAAKIKLGKAFKDQKVNLAQAYGERKQAIRLFNDNATRIVTALRAVKRGDIQGAAKALGITSPKRSTRSKRRKAEEQQQLDLSGRASSDWLALQYGWKPLMSDVVGAAEKVAQAHVDGILDTVRQSASSTRKIDSKIPLLVDGVEGYRYTASSYTAKYVIRAAIPRPELLSVTSLGFTNPLTVAWELMPWSFVIDWFIRIGDYLNYLDSFAGYRFLDGSFTIFCKTRSGATVAGEGETSYGPTIVHAVGSKISVENTREVLYDWPSLARPRFKNPVSVGHTLNALALFRTTFFKRK